MLNSLQGFQMDQLQNKQIVSDFQNINSLESFVDSSENHVLLKGAVTKIQRGDEIEDADLEGLTNNETELVQDLQKIKGIAGAGELAQNFSDLVGNYITSVDNKHKTAENAVKTFASGGNIDIHSVMIASEKANLAMQLTMQLRNKVLQAYQEIQNVRV